MFHLLKLLLIVAFLNGLSWIILIPIWQYPDEQAHFAQVQDIAELGKVPINAFDASYEIVLSEKILGTERDGFGNNKFTYHPEYKIKYSDGVFGAQEDQISSLSKSARTQLVKQESTVNPPLYYFLGSLAYRLFVDGSLFTRVYAVRFVSLIFFLGTVFLSYRIAKLVFEKNKIMQVALPTFIAFKPMLVFSSTGILPDTLTNFLFTLSLFFSLKILKDGLKTIILIWLLALTILLALTRQQFLIIVPIMILPITYQLIKKPLYLIKVIIFSAIFLLFITIGFRFLVSVGLVRNLLIPDIGNFNIQLLFKREFIDHMFWTTRHTIAEVWPWYWGVYKWLSLTLPPIVYQFINRLVAIAIAGLAIKFILMIRRKKIEEIDRYLIFMITASLVYFVIFLIWDYFFRLSHGFSFGIQGRYFFPLVVFHSAILLIGIRQILDLILKNYAKYGVSIILFLMILFNDISLSYVAASYYDTSNIAIFIRQANQYKPLIFKGNVLFVIILLAFFFQTVFIFKFWRYTMRKAR